MNKKEFLKTLLIIIALLFVMFLAHTVKNYIIISGLQDKILAYSNSTNYHIRLVSTEANGTVVTTDYYKKENIQAQFIERNLNGEIAKISIYSNGEKSNTYTDGKDSKTVKLNSDQVMEIGIYNQLETENKWQTFLCSMNSNITSMDIEGKNCYAINGFTSPTALSGENEVIYVEKDTGLLVKSISNQTSSVREYSFNNIDDSIFIEPNITEYTEI